MRHPLSRHVVAVVVMLALLAMGCSRGGRNVNTAESVCVPSGDQFYTCAALAVHDGGTRVLYYAKPPSLINPQFLYHWIDLTAGHVPLTPDQLAAFGLDNQIDVAPLPPPPGCLWDGTSLTCFSKDRPQGFQYWKSAGFGWERRIPVDQSANVGLPYHATSEQLSGVLLGYAIWAISGPAKAVPPW